MTPEQIQQNNELIARFMGLKIREEKWRAPHPTTVWLVDAYWTPAGKMEYHSSWDWLMPVGKKIFDFMQEDIKKRPPHTLSEGDWLESAISIPIREYDLAGAHQKIVDFIKWYNEQNKQP